ncbi:hypothetical protein AN189_13040 [Loktanella sp. 3ANDIMAR09]|uniref:DNA translocase FtsK n=1 Tax=Loktanella sp. 3ANDIMAR09 TaxID=1225657 RepID=UPI0006FB41E8|nr:DNA translocase FtsK [Loktanella sp. 3ANDIMAR09]KQI67992.1 hypothetical protein AN189_13040 [Loktanella sp. 3ANDIMAR09]
MKIVALTSGRADTDGALDEQKLNALGVNALNLVGSLTAALGPVAVLLKDQHGLGVMVNAGEASIVGFSADEVTEEPQEDREALYQRAVGLLVTTGKASTSHLQNKLMIRYNLAARLIERAEDDGIVSRPNGVGRRDVILRSQPVKS